VPPGSAGSLTIDIEARTAGVSQGMRQATQDVEGFAAGTERAAATLSRAQLDAQGQRVYNQTRTAAERYDNELSRLNQLEAQGAISAETHARAIQHLGEAAEVSGQSVRRLGHFFIIYKAVRTVFKGIGSAFELAAAQEQEFAAIATGDANKILSAQMKVQDAWGQLALGVPILGSAIKGAVDYFGDRAAHEQFMKNVLEDTRAVEQMHKEIERMNEDAEVRAAKAAGKPESEILKIKGERESKRSVEFVKDKQDEINKLNRDLAIAYTRFEGAKKDTVNLFTTRTTFTEMPAEQAEKEILAGRSYRTPGHDPLEDVEKLIAARSVYEDLDAKQKRAVKDQMDARDDATRNALSNGIEIANAQDKEAEKERKGQEEAKDRLDAFLADDIEKKMVANRKEAQAALEANDKIKQSDQERADARAAIAAEWQQKDLQVALAAAKKAGDEYDKYKAKQLKDWQESPEGKGASLVYELTDQLDALKELDPVLAQWANRLAAIDPIYREICKSLIQEIELTKKAQKHHEDAKTPLEKLGDEYAELDKELKAGKLSFEDYHRLIIKAAETEVGKKDKELDFGGHDRAAALEAGTAAAYSMALGSTRYQEKMARSMEQTAEATTLTNRHLFDIKQALQKEHITVKGFN
jgi:hypothetical protein